VDSTGDSTGDDSTILARVRQDLIGDDALLETPYGVRRVGYADYTASGRALGFVEDFVRDRVLPYYANTHTESSATAQQTTRLYDDAREIVHRGLGADADTIVIFTGSGATGAVNKLVAIMNLALPRDLDDKYRLSALIPAAERPVVFVGPYEHHSNELPWRESVADVVEIPQDAEGHVDLAALDLELQHYADRPLLIGSFSAASNVTGILTDTAAVSSLLHRHGALSFWDYAAAAPYVPIDMGTPAEGPGYHDAVFISPHKFVGGPGAVGILAVRTDIVRNSVPTAPGGGTVTYVNATHQVYRSDLAAREEGGTPNIVGAIRAGLAFQLKADIGTDVIMAREHLLWHRALAVWSTNPNIEIMGDCTVPRLSIVSFVLTRNGMSLHHNLVVALLNDLFGIQARGGCSCAGPYGHRLLGITEEQSREIERRVSMGDEGMKPGWSRVSFPYVMSDELAAYIVDAVMFVADEGWRFLTDYVFDAHTGLWQHRSGRRDVDVRLSDLRTSARPAARTPSAAPSYSECLALASELAARRDGHGEWDRVETDPACGCGSRTFALPGAATRSVRAG
jgi:selenocysteine lyase/cysteine desulfurase